MSDEGGTIGKAFQILDRVAAAGRPVRFSEVLAQGEWPKATLYRLLQTLAAQGALTYDAARQTYAPGLRLVRLAHAAWAQSSLAPIGKPWMDKLAAETGETLYLAQLEQGQVVYVDKRNAARPAEMFTQAGKVGPAYCTGVGKAMLAFLAPEELEGALERQSFYAFTPQTITSPEALRAELAMIRARGHALDRREHRPETICVAAPILTRGGRMLGAMSITSSVQKTTLERLERYAPRLRSAAAAIGEEAETWRFPERDDT